MKRLGIKYQLRLTTLIPVLLVALLFALFYNGEFNKDLNQYTSRIGEAYVRQLLPAAQLALMRNDQRILQGLINATIINPEIKAIAFYDMQGQLIAYRGGKHPLNQPFVSPKFTGDYVQSQPVDAYTVNFVSPIILPKFNLYSNLSTKSTSKFSRISNNDIIGWLSVDVDTQSMQIKRYRMYIITIVITLLGLLISLSIHFFLSRQIYVPIMRLRRSMRQILSNEFETHISTNSKGELGVIEQGCVHLQNEYLKIVHDLDHHIEIANQDLQQSLELLEEKNIQLSLEKKKTEEKSRQKSEFIANMSHEIRTPMNGVIGFTNVLMESKLDPLQLDYVKTIKSSAQDLLNIISDILDYSKMDAGKLHLDCIPIDIRACIDEVVTLVSSKAKKKGVDLISSTEINVAKTMLGDSLRIKQILTNLISNAVKFTEQGYIIVRTKIDEETDKDYSLSISVIDTGIGISSEDQTKLFNAFNQADTSITRRFGGTGLGLVICKKLAEAMQGKITLSSELHKGSNFTIKIKLEKFSSYEIEKNQSNKFENINALCFDDNALHLEALCNGIGFWGINCIPVTSFTQLADAFTKNTDCEIAFVSVTEGFEKQIAQILRKQTIPIVLVSKSLINDPIALGAQAFLFKPVGIQKLKDVIETILNQASKSLSELHELDTLRNKMRLIHPNILVAEDNPVNRMLLNSLFKENANLDTVENGDEALTACQEKHYDVLLLDLRMPKLNGLEAARLIRKESTLNKSTPIVVLSANTSDIDPELFKQSGISLSLQKPIDEKQLLTHLLKLLNKAKAPAIDWSLCVQKVSGNQKLAEEFLSRFVQELYVARLDFKELFEKEDIQGLEMAAHKLYGAGCFCGVPRLQIHVTHLEKLAKKVKNFSDLKTAFIELIQSIDEVIDEFESLYSSDSTASDLSKS